MDNSLIWDNLLIGIEMMLAKGIPMAAIRELRIVFTQAFAEGRITQETIDRFNELILG